MPTADFLGWGNSTITKKKTGLGTDRKHVMRFRVRGSKFDGGPVVWQADNIPQIGSTCPGDGFAKCKNYSVSEDSDDGQLYIVEANFETPDANEDEQQEPPPENGFPEDLQVSGSFVATRKVFEKDTEDRAVVNSAGDRFDPQPEVDSWVFVVTIARNESPPFDLTTVTQYHGTVSEGPFASIEGDKCLLLVQGFEGGVHVNAEGEKFPFVRVSYQVHINNDGWDAHYLNQGYRYRDDNSALAIAKINGVQTPNPVMLYQDGRIIPDANLPDSVTYSHYKPYKAVSWQPLNLEV